MTRGGQNPGSRQDLQNGFEWGHQTMEGLKGHQNANTLPHRTEYVPWFDWRCGSFLICGLDVLWNTDRTEALPTTVLLLLAI